MMASIRANYGVMSVGQEGLVATWGRIEAHLGRLDSTVGYAAAADLLEHYPHASLAVLDDAGHALPHEQPELLRALLAEWLTRVERSN